MKKVKGYKGFNKGLICKPNNGITKQYEVGETYIEDVDPELCKTGMHFCEMPLDVFNYYPPVAGSEYTEVEALGKCVKEGDKTATNKLTIKSKLSIAGLFKAHFDIVREIVKKAVEGVNTNMADKGHASAAGNYGHASAAGNEGHASAAGDGGHASAAGYLGHASAAGDRGHASAAGNEGHASAAGYGGHASAAGDEAIASSLGVRGRSIASKGWIIVVDWRFEENWYIQEIYRAKVGKNKIKGQLIKPDTWYWFEDGELKSEKS